MNRGQRIWQSVYQRELRNSIVRIRILESPLFLEQEIVLPPYAAIIGPHGSGKSALGRMIAASVGSFIERHFGPPFINISGDDRLGYLRGVVEVTVRVNGAEHTRTVDLTDDYYTREEIWKGIFPQNYHVPYFSPIQTFSYIDESIYQNAGSTAFHREIATAPSYKFRSEELKNIRRILGRTFDSLEVRVGPDFIDEVPAVDAFGKSGTTKLNFFNMSSGEIWVIYTLGWGLRSANSGGSLVLDEPETFLSSRALRAYAQEIARLAVAREIQIFAITHSPEFALNVPLDSVLMCNRVSGKISVTNPSSISQIRDSVGMETLVRGQVLVEDEMAKRLTCEILSKANPGLASQIDVLPCGGASNVRHAIKTLTSTPGRIRYIGILDGDQRSSSTPSIGSPMLFLPGQEPEFELLSAIEDNLAEISNELDRSQSDLIFAISVVSDVDHQKWFESIARRLAINLDTLINIAVKYWSRKPPIADQISELAAEIKRRVET